MNTTSNCLDAKINKIDTLFFDLDGTLLDSKKEISNSCLNLMKECKNEGFHFGIATGRSLSSIYPLMKKFKLDEIFEVVVANSGADIYLLPEWKEIQLGHLTREDVIKIKNCFMNKDDIVIAFHNPDTMFATKETPFLKSVQKNNHESQFKKLFEEDEYELPARVMLEFHQDSTLEYILSKPIDGLKGYHSEPEIYEFLKDHVSKSNGIRYYMQTLGKEIDQVMCFGDGDNDEEMLTHCAIGVAMQNGTQKAKNAANIQWKYSNDEDGVYEFLKEYIRK